MSQIHQIPLLWESFVSLSSQELRDMGRLVRSPFFNRKQQLVHLFDYLCACRAGEALPDPEAAFAAAYPHIPFDVSKLRLAYSDLLDLIDTYWVVAATLKDQPRRAIHLAVECRHRGLSRRQPMTLREAKSGVAQYPYRNASYYELLYELELEIYQVAAADKRYDTFNLQEISNWADVAFIARKLQHWCTALSHQTVFKTAYHFGLLDAIYAAIESENLLQYPVVALYYHATHFLSDASSDVHFLQFSEVLRREARFFPEAEQRALYRLAINFGVKKCNTGPQEWLRFTFDLYREALERALLTERGNLSRFAYNNIAVIGSKLGEIAWVEQFLTAYKPLLDRAWREASFSLNMARLEYQRQHYKAALHYLQHADYKDFINSMNARLLQLKIFYDTGETDVLESHLDSMQRYIKRHRAVGYHRDNYLSIVQFTRTLLHLPLQTATAATDLYHAIEASTGLTERVWLLEKVQRYVKTPLL